MIAISTYFTISATFLLVGMIPDLAVIRDRVTGWRRWVYGLLSSGWRGTDRQWSNYLKAYAIFAGLATPLVISVHSVVSWDFAVSVVPGWHTTIFAPYFVAGAIHSGFAMVLTLLVPLRKIFKVEDLITARQLEQMSKVVILTGMIVGYVISQKVRANSRARAQRSGARARTRERNHRIFEREHEHEHEHV